MSSYPFDTIFTLEARSNLFLEVTARHFNLCDEAVFDLIQARFFETTQILASKKVDYQKLRRALVPSIDRNERALVFDYTRFNVRLYGREVIHSLLQHLGRESTHSLLAGEWLGNGVFSDWLAISPSACGTVDRQLADVRYQPFYFVYLNNLSPAGSVALDQLFTGHPAYIGCLDLNRATPLKAYLSTFLIRDFIKHRNVIIKGHEDDRDPEEDYNLSFFDFEKFGMTLRSLPSTLYEVFLSYKIERPPLPEELDRKFSLSAMSTTPVLLDDFQVVLEDAKFEYLRENKAGSLKRAGFEELTAEGVAAKSRSKVNANYIYSLARATRGQTLKFNVILEADTGARTECALEYRPVDKTLRVITFY
jgi:hypothetical protein